MAARRRSTPSLIRTARRIEHGLDQLDRLYQLARELCRDEFVAEETREFKALYAHVSLGLVDELRTQLARKLDVPSDIFSRDRFSIHGCGPVGLHDDFFRFPYVYFVIVIAHAGRLGLVDAGSRAALHEPGEIILLDPRGKHALVPEGLAADEYPYESTHSPVREEQRQFLFLDFDVRRPDLRSLFRAR